MTDKPVGLKTWILIGLLFLGLVLYQVFEDIQQSYSAVFVDTYYHLAYLLAHRDPALFRLDALLNDPVVADRAYIAYPAYYFLMEQGIRLLGLFTTLSLFQLLLGVTYLLSMFFLLFRFTKRPWLSAFIAALSAVRTSVFPGEVWGALSVGLVIPGTFFLAVSPLLFLGWLKSQDNSRQRRLLFLLVGVAGVFHPLSWLTVAFSMLLAQLIHHRFSPASLKDAMICGGLSVVPLIPFIIEWTRLSSLNQLMPEAEQARAAEILTSIFLPVRARFLWEHWTDSLVNLAWVVITAWALWKASPRVPRLALYFMAGPVLLFLSAYVLNELLLLPNHMVFIDGYRTLKYLFLPATLIIALWLRPFQGTPLLIRCGLVWLALVVLNVPMLWRDIQQAPLALHRHIFRQWISFVMPHSPEQLAQHRDVQEAATWIRRMLPRKDILIHVSLPRLTDPAKVRALAERSITNTLLDGGPTYLFNREKIANWWDVTVMFETLRRRYGYCSDNEMQTAKSMGATHMLCPVGGDKPAAKEIYRNDSVVLYALEL